MCPAFHRTLRRPVRRQLAGLVATALVVGAAMAADGLPVADPPAVSAADAALADQVVDAVNRYRASQQLQPLRPSADLAALAATHSAQLARLQRLTHAGFEQRFARARRQTCVENLAAGFTRAEPMIAGWRISPDHHRNLLDARVEEVGVASVAGHVTWLACSGR
jgi:uncharacterized protein YkwD